MGLIPRLLRCYGGVLVCMGSSGRARRMRCGRLWLAGKTLLHASHFCHCQ